MELLLRRSVSVQCQFGPRGLGWWYPEVWLNDLRVDRRRSGCKVDSHFYLFSLFRSTAIHLYSETDEYSLSVAYNHSVLSEFHTSFPGCSNGRGNEVPYLRGQTWRIKRKRDMRETVEEGGVVAGSRNGPPSPTGTPGATPTSVTVLA